MKINKNTFLGLFFFFASVFCTTFFEKPLFSLSFCLCIYTMLQPSQNNLYFFGFLYLFEQFIWHGHIAIPFLSLCLTMFMTNFLQRVTLLPTPALGIISVPFYLVLKKIAFPWIFSASASSGTLFLYELGSSLAIVLALLLYHKKK